MALAPDALIVLAGIVLAGRPENSPLGECDDVVAPRNRLNASIPFVLSNVRVPATQVDQWRIDCAPLKRMDGESNFQNEMRQGIQQSRAFMLESFSRSRKKDPTRKDISDICTYEHLLGAEN